MGRGKGRGREKSRQKVAVEGKMISRRNDDDDHVVKEELRL